MSRSSPLPRIVVCSICGLPFNAAQSASTPFCSPRCQKIDLGRWLDERYGLPIERDPPEESDSAELDSEEAESE